MKKLIFTFLTTLSIGTATLQAQWTQKAPMSSARDGAVSWTINDKFYVTGGEGRSDLRMYDPTTNHWTIKAAIPQGVTEFAMGFVINSKGYLCGGVSPNGAGFGSLFEYDPSTNQWTAKASLPESSVRSGGFGFSAGGKGYIGCGDDGEYLHPDVFEYDPVADSWAIKAQFPGSYRSFPYSFTIGNTGYVGGGEGASSGNTTVEYNDLWEYDQANDAWNQRSAMPAAPRQAAASFASATKGYVALGQTAYTSMFNDVFEYDQANDVWDTIASFTPGPRAWPVGFAHGDSIYICSGWNFSVFYGDLYALSLAKAPVSPVGIKTFAKAAVSVYPNPAKGEVNVLLPSASAAAFIELYNPLGELVKKQSLPQMNNQLQLTELPKGMYSLKVTDHGTVIAVSKLIRD